jgi:hypothetical protein
MKINYFSAAFLAFGSSSGLLVSFSAIFFLIVAIVAK